jgi:signal transduction histidine kinase
LRWLLFLLVLVYAPTVFLGDVPAVIDWVDELVPIVVPGIVAVLCVGAGRRTTERSRAIWVLLAAGCGMWAAGDIAYTVLDRTGNPPGPFSVADVGYFSLILAWSIALIVHPSTPRRGLDLAGASVDALTIMVVASSSTVAYVVTPVVDSGLPLLDEAVLLAYPMGDLIMLAAFTFLLARSRSRAGSGTPWVGAATLLLLVADSAYARLTVAGAYETGSPTDLVWIAAFASIGIAASRSLPFTRPEDSRDAQAVSILGTIATALLVVLAALQTHRTIVGAGAALAACFVVVRRVLFLVQTRRLMGTVTEHAKLSEEVAAAKEAFVAEASHQLRSPLTSIRVRLDEMNVIGLHDPLAAEYLDELSIEVDRLRRLAERLLTLASTAVVRPREPRDVMAVVREAADRLAQRARLAQVNLEVYPFSGEALVIAGPGALEESLTNLIDNALKYSPRGGTVTIGVSTSEGFHEIWVEDDGPGIDDEMADRLFEPFYRLASHKPGYGLGLAIVKRICDTEGVPVSLTGRPQGGTRALMRWPAHVVVHL